MGSLKLSLEWFEGLHNGAPWQAFRRKFRLFKNPFSRLNIRFTTHLGHFTQNIFWGENSALLLRRKLTKVTIVFNN